MCPHIVCLLMFPMGQRGHKGLAVMGESLLSPQAQPLPFGCSPSCLTGHPQLCFCWQRWTERISDVSCAALGGLQGDTAGEPTSPSALAEQGYAGLEGQRDSWRASWEGEPVGHEVALGLCLVPENNAEALFLLPWAKRGVCVLVGGLALLGTPALLCTFCKGCRGWPSLSEPLPVRVSLLPCSASP